jgi:hypothetical protein
VSADYEKMLPKGAEPEVAWAEAPHEPKPAQPEAAGLFLNGLASVRNRGYVFLQLKGTNHEANHCKQGH